MKEGKKYKCNECEQEFSTLDHWTKPQAKCKTWNEETINERKERIEKKKTLNQVLGLVAIAAMIIVNTFLIYIGNREGSTEILNNFGWGFINALVIMTSLIMMTSDK